jgi:hypothetical protein
MNSPLIRAGFLFMQRVLPPMTVEAVPMAGTITCARTGLVFEYRGYGRPPRYHPDARKAVQAERNRQSYNRKKARRSAMNGEP